MTNKILDSLSSDWISTRDFLKKSNIPASTFYLAIRNVGAGPIYKAFHQLLDKQKIEISSKRSRKGNRVYYYLRKLT